MAETQEQKKQSKVPILPWMRSPVDVTLFEQSPLALLPCLDPRLMEALQDMGFSSLFPVQVAVWQETIGPGAFERDLCVNSPTGSGKTLAYALPIVQALSTRAVKCLRALVVLPTRDLALQHLVSVSMVKEVFSAIAPAVGLSVGLAVGQSSIADEISELIKRPKLEAGICYDPEDFSPGLQSSVDILVATPGRLMDHINSTKGFTLEHLCYLVVDETDRLLREAYQSWLPTVLQMTRYDEGFFPRAPTFLPLSLGSLKTIRRSGVERGFKGKPYPRLVKMILSATLTQDPSKLAQLDLHHPLFLTTGKTRYQFPEKLESFKLVRNGYAFLSIILVRLDVFRELLKARSRFILNICETKDKPLYLVALLQKLEGEKCIVFTSSVESTHRLCTLLNFFDDLPFKIKEYSGLQRQSVRSKALKGFREGEIQVLVSSDAMTRGMDVEGVKNVINYDMPAYIKTYIHRAGRTARAGQAGRCFTLLRKEEVKHFKKLLQKADDNSCPVYEMPSSSVESMHSIYTSALEKLKETVETEASQKRKVGFKYLRAANPMLQPMFQLGVSHRVGTMAQNLDKTQKKREIENLHVEQLYYTNIPIVVQDNYGTNTTLSPCIVMP
ncbi:hypothetical protein F8388_013462 [Cannabis sativa]|uniref:ATP-dependent RNA helicase n=1 Tax=Cannabis sativa TaxID=3483 RepID=A0A7J6EXL2_CANSA|nr:hypothetical protein F8388_013462 [Cannabis sativa]KAF4381889.1 hypothetical protein G4B88_001184 [Cannabis sativa]